MKKKTKRSSSNVVNLSFHVMLTFIAVFVALVSIFVYSNVFKSIENHTVEENILETKSACKLVDTIIEQSETTVHLLSLDSVVKEYFNIKNLSLFGSNTKTKLTNRIQQITFINEYVVSCYFYTLDNDFMYCYGNGDSSSGYEKNELKSHILPYGADVDIEIYPTNYCGNYPHYIRFLKQFDYNGRRCAIALNLDFVKLVKLLNLENIYVVGDGKIIYSGNSDEVLLPVNENSLLKSFYENSEKPGILKTKTGEYVISSCVSDEYGWSYIGYNKLDGYYKGITQKKILLYAFIVIIFVIGIIIAVLHKWGVNKSLKYVSDMIESPEIIGESEKHRQNKLMDEISAQILTYMNVNRRLKYELEDRIIENKNLFFNVKQLQINPHFMFNILNSVYISSMDGNTEKTSKMLLMLSKYMRYVLGNENNFIRVEEEIKNTKIYLELLQIRYPALEEFEFYVREDLNNVQIIKFCLQPIVENAVYHGITNLKNKGGKLQISVTENNGIVYVTAKDNGTGMSREKLEKVVSSMKNISEPAYGKHIGLRNVYQRIKVMYGDKYGVQITSAPDNGTIVTLTMPLIK